MRLHPKEYKKVWGKEVWICNTDDYCSKFLHIDKGAKLSLHFHKNKDEVFYCLKGKVVVTLVFPEGEPIDFELTEGETVRIFPCTPHTVESVDGPATLLEVSTHHEDSDSYRITKSTPGVSE